VLQYFYKSWIGSFLYFSSYITMNASLEVDFHFADPWNDFGPPKTLHPGQVFSSPRDVTRFEDPTGKILLIFRDKNVKLCQYWQGGCFVGYISCHWSQWLCDTHRFSISSTGVISTEQRPYHILLPKNRKSLHTLMSLQRKLEALLQTLYRKQTSL